MSRRRQISSAVSTRANNFVIEAGSDVSGHISYLGWSSTRFGLTKTLPVAALPRTTGMLHTQACGGGIEPFHHTRHFAFAIPKSFCFKLFRCIQIAGRWKRNRPSLRMPLVLFARPGSCCLFPTSDWNMESHIGRCCQWQLCL
jgi:hypothetical protein